MVAETILAEATVGDETIILRRDDTLESSIHYSTEVWSEGMLMGSPRSYEGFAEALKLFLTEVEGRIIAREN